MGSRQNNPIWCSAQCPRWCRAAGSGWLALRQWAARHCVQEASAASLGAGAVQPASTYGVRHLPLHASRCKKQVSRDLGQQGGPSPPSRQ